VKLTDCKVFAYNWSPWDDFLLAAVVPWASVIPAAVGDAVDEICSHVRRAPSLFIFHIDCTLTARFPIHRVELLHALVSQGVVLLNSDVTDISKRALHRACRSCSLPCPIAMVDGAPDDLLIVKSNLNCGGTAELELQPQEREFTTGYPVLRRSEVPQSWWSDDLFVIEHFIENRDQAWLCLYVLGNRAVLSRAINPNRIKKVAPWLPNENWCFMFDGRFDGCPSEYLSAVQSCRSICKVMGLEFGSFDIMYDDVGTFYVVDANSTPYWSIFQNELVDYLRCGLDLFVTQLKAGDERVL
jgi:hypothetical protein